MSPLAIETENIRFQISGEVVAKMRRFWREHDFTMGIDLLDAQRSLFTAQQAVVQIRLAQLQNQVTLYKALGGGWKD